MEEVEALQLELNVNLNERQAQFGATKVLKSTNLCLKYLWEDKYY